jgi:hypothetical protein
LYTGAGGSFGSAAASVFGSSAAGVVSVLPDPPQAAHMPASAAALNHFRMNYSSSAISN